MKKVILALSLILVLLLAVACMADRCHQQPDTQPGTTLPSTIPTVPTTAPTVPETEPTQPPIADGWHVENDRRYYYENGRMLTGWQTIDGLRRYFLDDGTLSNGWVELADKRCYFDAEGIPVNGWLKLEDGCYYLDSDGAAVTGWLELEETRYYFREDGTMARGCVEIDGKKHYFTSTGAYILLVNVWNYVPEGYEPDLVDLIKFANYDNMYIDRQCYEQMVQMLQDCRSEVSKAVVVSAYRTHEFQTRNYQREVQKWLNRGYSQEEAERLAAQAVLIPGTSEHQLGLAVDIVDVNWPYLDEKQAQMPAQKWLMEHCWEYGFILRYPEGKTDVTGIIYEPWHYRYVGKELAKELTELGLTLEEYMTALTNGEL
jgi:LAS superfamily LD-carboxypeptidase LdcB